MVDAPWMLPGRAPADRPLALPAAPRRDDGRRGGRGRASSWPFKERLVDGRRAADPWAAGDRPAALQPRVSRACRRRARSAAAWSSSTASSPSQLFVGPRQGRPAAARVPARALDPRAASSCSTARSATSAACARALRRAEALLRGARPSDEPGTRSATSCSELGFEPGWGAHGGAHARDAAAALRHPRGARARARSSAFLARIPMIFSIVILSPARLLRSVRRAGHARHRRPGRLHPRPGAGAGEGDARARSTSRASTSSRRSWSSPA